MELPVLCSDFVILETAIMFMYQAYVLGCFFLFLVLFLVLAAPAGLLHHGRA